MIVYISIKETFFHGSSIEKNSFFYGFDMKQIFFCSFYIETFFFSLQFLNREKFFSHRSNSCIVLIWRKNFSLKRQYSRNY